jgi:hypothetical protein
MHTGLSLLLEAVRHTDCGLLVTNNILNITEHVAMRAEVVRR